MSSKTEDELNAIIENNFVEVEDARQAAIWELEKRANEAEIGFDKQEDLTLTKKETSNNTSRFFQFNIKDPFLTDDPRAPELYSKRAIIGFSILFSTLFGAVLLMSNLKTLENKKARIGVLYFGIIFSGLIMMIASQFEINANVGLPLNVIGGLLLTEFFWNRDIGKNFLHRKKKIWKPLFISVLFMIPFLLAILYGG